QGDGRGRFATSSGAVTDSDATANARRLRCVVAGGLGCRPERLMDTNMLKALTGGSLLAVDDEVLEAKLERIGAEPAGNLVDMGLQGEDSLWLAWGAHETAGEHI